jgi:hypothetical protein
MIVDFRLQIADWVSAIQSAIYNLQSAIDRRGEPMRGPEIPYRCQSCGQISPRNDLPRNSWGDPSCPACGSLHIERYYSKADSLYASFFLFKVY